jgi:hypothetical protein
LGDNKLFRGEFFGGDFAGDFGEFFGGDFAGDFGEFFGGDLFGEFFNECKRETQIDSVSLPLQNRGSRYLFTRVCKVY